MMTNLIKRLLAKRQTRDAEDDLSAIAPAERFYAVGDIHGRLDLLQAILTRIDGDCRTVFVGDYIDRGDYSAQVLRHLHHLSETSKGRVICLLGNHEEMLLRFLEDPEQVSGLWFRNGGLQTLASFGIKNVTPEDNADAVATQLRQAMGEALVTWLSNRPLIWTSGNVSVVHAALDPDKPVEEQPRQTCLWGRPHYSRARRADGQWVVHGHTIVDQARIMRGVISIDTGAFATGRLTAAEVFPSGVRFTSTR